MWTYDASRRHAVTQAGSSAYGYTYDANGNVTSREGFSATWSSFNQPNVINGSGESVTFAYKHDHTRWSAVYSGSTGVETTYFIGDLLEKVASAGSIDYRQFIYAGNTKVAIYTRTTGGVNTLRYIREDLLGGVSGLVNSDGTSYVKESFTAYGARRSACTWSGPPTAGNLQTINAVTRHGFTWQTALGAMGLNDMNGRIQDAVTGRFLSPDPTVPEPDNTQSYNRYSYVRNNPLTFADPSGFEEVNIPLKPSGDLGPDFSGWGFANIDWGDQNAASDDQSPTSQVVVTGSRPVDSSAGVPLAFSSGSGPATWHPRPQQPQGIPKPQGSQLAEVVVTARKWLCTAGNFLAEGADKLGNVSGKLELGGLGVAGVSFVAAQPEGVAVGLGLAATGGTGNIIAGGLQVTAGLLQGAGGGGFGNAGYGALSLATGFTLARGIVGPAASGYRTVSQRAADAFANGTATVAGGVNDLWTSLIDSASPQQVGCPGGH
jgi:RHS repeat-associated protein